MRAAASIFALSLCISSCGNDSKTSDSKAISDTAVLAQCMKDTDCKGDRICDKGICVAPTNHALIETVATEPQDETQKNSLPVSFAQLGSDALCEEGKNGIPSLGSSYQGGFYICREPVEIYWNEWYASLEGSEQNKLHVQSEGKTSAFSGTLTINCKKGKVSWADATDSEMPLATDQDIAEVVPSQVILNATKYFCKS